jgi:lysophospholipase L1-like esterase
MFPFIYSNRVNDRHGNAYTASGGCAASYYRRRDIASLSSEQAFVATNLIRMECFAVQIIQQWKEQTQQSFRIVAFGSSNTELSWDNGGRHNWVDWLNLNLRAHIGRHICLINQGIGGETTENLLGRMGRDVFSFQPSVVIVTIGGNDAIQGFTLRQYSDNLRKICSLIRENNALPVLQSYYCPVYHQGNASFKQAFESFMQAVRILAQEMDIPLVDQYKRFEPFYRKHPEQYGKLMRDWMHVNHLGNLIMGMQISSSFGLPDIQIPEDIKPEAQALINQMNDCCDE